MEFISASDERDPAYFLLEGTKVTLRIFESARQTERDLTPKEKAERRANPNGYVYIPNRYNFAPTGKIRLEGMLLTRGSPQFSIVDATDALVHERIGEVPSKLMEFAVVQKSHRDHWAELERKSAERQRLLAEKARARDAELSKLASFEKLALDIERAGRLRGLVAALSIAAAPGGKQYDHATLDWISNAADWLDPMVRRHWPAVDDAQRL